MTFPNFYPFGDYDPEAPWWRRQFFMDTTDMPADPEIAETIRMNDEHMEALMVNPNAPAPPGMPPDIAEENRIIAKAQRGEG